MSQTSESNDYSPYSGYDLSLERGRPSIMINDEPLPTNLDPTTYRSSSNMNIRTDIVMEAEEIKDYIVDASTLPKIGRNMQNMSSAE